MDYWEFLEKGYGLLATKFKDYGLFVLHFKITDYYQSSSHRLPLHRMVLKVIKRPPARSHGKNSEPKDNVNRH